ncbi:hypothetical protein ACFC9J_14375 [Enterococcus casseliflavus]|uniref:hypothetical protein n=1 Tax=Enterococcus casseliflavus TaxID=37734 RepID=UPI0039A7345C
MSNLDNGRNAIKTYMKKNNLTEQAMATAYGVSRTWMQQVLNGSRTGPTANSLVIEIIRDLKIQETEEV